MVVKKITVRAVMATAGYHQVVPEAQKFDANSRLEDDEAAIWGFQLHSHSIPSTIDLKKL